MSKNPFENSVLFISARSPFARRVRLALHEHGVRYEERVFDLFAAPETLQDLYRLNPMGRVPAIRLATGEVIVDSTQILEVFYSVTPTQLIPQTLTERARMAFYSGVATGLCDKTVEWFIDTNRPTQNPDVRQELDQFMDLSLTQLEAELAGKQWVCGSLSQADLDLGTVLTYLSLRIGKEWQRKFPRCASYAATLETRPSFQATVPPPAQ